MQHDLLIRFRERAARKPRRIVYPEGTDPRILRAARAVADSAMAIPVLIGKGAAIEAVAKQTGVTPQLISMEGGSAGHIAAVAKAVQAAKGVVLVVGHSNTVPAIIKALGGPTLPDICDATYGHFFVLVPARDGQPAALTISHFGAAEPAPPASCAGMTPK